MRTFVNEEFCGKLRTFKKDDDIWFLMGDIADAICVDSASEMFHRVNPDDKNIFSFTTEKGKNIRRAFVNESGLNQVINFVCSDEALSYYRWIITKVIPDMKNQGQEEVRTMKPKSDIQVFSNPEFGEVRVIEKDSEPWFVGKDVAKVLGYSDTAQAIRKHVDGEDKGVVEMTTPGGKQSVTIINESGLYSLILSSKLPSAKKFKHWVTYEVLPSIRKYGMYATPQTLDNMISDPDFAIRLFTELKNEREKNKELKISNEHKANVITALTEDVSLAEKRQRINQIIRFNTAPNQYSARWKLLYSEFDKKYHMNIRLRFENQKYDFKPALKSIVDYVDRGLHMIPEMYELTCKLFEGDFHALLREWSNVITDEEEYDF